LMDLCFVRLLDFAMYGFVHLWKSRGPLDFDCAPN
jgi:hypothetical protein